MNLLTDSKITTRFIQKKFSVELDNVEQFYLEPKDVAIMIDNGFNESLRMSKFSKFFKESFQSIIAKHVTMDTKDFNKKMKLVWRRT